MDNQPANNNPSLPPAPDTWPGAFGLYKYSKQAVKFNVETILLLWILNAVIGGGVEVGFRRTGGVLGFIIGSLLTAAMISAYLASLRGQKQSVGDAFNKALNYWLKMIGLNILVFLSLFASVLLLVVPFFFVLPRLTLANYFLVDKDLDIVEAYKASWNATRGHAQKAWGVILANVAMALLMVTIIGIPFAIYFLFMYSAAFAVFYLFVNKAEPSIV